MGRDADDIPANTTWRGVLLHSPGARASDSRVINRTNISEFFLFDQKDTKGQTPKKRSELPAATCKMATSFSSLPILSLQALKTGNPSQDDLDALGRVLYDTFATTGFAYLVDFPLSFSDDEVFGLAKEFFTLPTEEKMKVAKRIFCKENKNTYRG